jgi:hypothetical protein
MLHLLVAKRFELLSHEAAERLQRLAPHVGVENLPQIFQRRAVLGVGRARGGALSLTIRTGHLLGPIADAGGTIPPVAKAPAAQLWSHPPRIGKA